VNEALETFDTFFQCTSYLAVTQYGDPAGTLGYVFDPGTGVTFKNFGARYHRRSRNGPVPESLRREADRTVHRVRAVTPRRVRG